MSYYFDIERIIFWKIKDNSSLYTNHKQIDLKVFSLSKYNIHQTKGVNFIINIFHGPYCTLFNHNDV